MQIELELLAPAKNREIGIAAVDCGADALYMAGPEFGAREAAGNTMEEIARTVEYASRFGVKVYLTLNTILYETELPAARKMVYDAYEAGCDAVIVQDMALLRASDKNIISTTRGYLLYKEDVSKVKRAFVVRHTNENIREELYSIVDCGGKMLDVSVFHNVYGMITVDLIIQNRREADDFLQKMNKINSEPLLTLTNGKHIHTIEADNEEILDRIEQVLRKQGFLVEENND